MNCPDDSPLLSICLATYNRRDLVVALVRELLGFEGDFEICVHVDGSSDGSAESLKKLNYDQLRISYGSNVGRAGALMTACESAHGRFIMLLDDDDSLSAEGLSAVLSDCAKPLPDGVVGYIYHLDNGAGRLGSDFPVNRTNFLALRGDHLVKGDKKEVVLATAFREVAYPATTPHRRIPTSLIWSRLALKYDVFCRNIKIGYKNYLSDGMTAKINKTKRKNPLPMMELYKVHLEGFKRRRFLNWRYALRSFLGFVYYYLISRI